METTAVVVVVVTDVVVVEVSLELLTYEQEKTVFKSIAVWLRSG